MSENSLRTVPNEFCKGFSNCRQACRFFSKTAKTDTLTLDGGKLDFAPGKPPLSSEETHGLLRGESEGDFEAGGAMLKMYEHFVGAAKLIENVLPDNRRIFQTGNV